jgi:hypothetical protein
MLLGLMYYDVTTRRRFQSRRLQYNLKFREELDPRRVDGTSAAHEEFLKRLFSEKD